MIVSLGVEDRFLVFLQILVVAARQAFHRGEEPGQPADRAPGLAAHQLHRIGVLLLRHQAAAGRDPIVEIDEPELLAAENDDVLGQPADVDHAQRHGWRNDETKSRSATASMLLATTRENPRRDASAVTSMR